jgi:hypothetical protein
MGFTQSSVVDPNEDNFGGTKPDEEDGELSDYCVLLHFKIVVRASC